MILWIGSYRGWLGALLARRTRTIGMCSFDARSEGQSGNSLERKGGEGSERETEDPRWTRAVGDHTSPPSRETMKECGCSMRTVKASLPTPYQEKGVLSIFRLPCSRSRSFLRSISNSAVADVVPLSMPHMLRMYCFVMGWKRMSRPCSMKHTFVPVLMHSFRRSRDGMTIRPLVVT